MVEIRVGHLWGEKSVSWGKAGLGGDQGSTTEASDLPVNDHLSLQGYEGSLIKLTSRQVISLQGFSSSQSRLTAEIGTELVLFPSILRHLAAETCPLPPLSCPRLTKE